MPLPTVSKESKKITKAETPDTTPFVEDLAKDVSCGSPRGVATCQDQEHQSVGQIRSVERVQARNEGIATRERRESLPTSRRFNFVKAFVIGLIFSSIAVVLILLGKAYFGTFWEKSWGVVIAVALGTGLAIQVTVTVALFFVIGAFMSRLERHLPTYNTNNIYGVWGPAQHDLEYPQDQDGGGGQSLAIVQYAAGSTSVLAGPDEGHQLAPDGGHCSQCGDGVQTFTLAQYAAGITPIDAGQDLGHQPAPGDGQFNESTPKHKNIDAGRQSIRYHLRCLPHPIPINSSKCAKLNCWLLFIHCS